MPLKRGKGPARGAGLKRKPKPRRTPEETDASRAWWEAVVWDEDKGRVRPCARCGSRRRVQGHHVISQQALVLAGRSDLLWDARNGLALCEGCHERHTNAFRPIPRRLLKEPAWRFAREAELVWRIEREYPADG